MGRHGRAWIAAPATAAVAVLVAIAVGAAAGAAPERGERIEGDVIVAGSASPLIDRLRIARRPANSARVALSIGQGALRDPGPGARLEATAKLQFDVCVKRAADAHRECLGDVYGYDPRIEAYLLLASSDSATRPRRGERLGRTERITCRQDRAAPNHHCVIDLPWSGAELRRGGRPCRLGSCRINVVVRASSPRAGRRDYVAFGGVTADGDRVRNKSTLSAGRSLIGRPLRFGRPKLDRAENTARLPLAAPGRPVQDRVVYSVPVRHVSRFESVVVDGRFSSSIDGLGRAVRTRTQLILARSPRSTRPARHLPGVSGEQLTDSTNFNCTRRPSAHRNPCQMGERAAVEVKADSRRGFFINLIAGHGALDEDDAGAAARVLDGRLKVWRYKP